MGRRIQMRTLPVLRARSASPRPTGYLDTANEGIEHKDRRGWYRVDFGGNQDPKMWWLPRMSERLKFLEKKVEAETAALRPYPRASSVPPALEEYKPVRTARLRRAMTPSPYYTKRYPRLSPSDTSLVDMYHPTLGPYYGRLWSLPDFLNPIAGRDRVLSNPITVSSSWKDSHPVDWPTNKYKGKMTIKPESTKVEEERQLVLPFRRDWSYTPSVETQLALARADRTLRMIADYEVPQISRREELDLAHKYRERKTEVKETVVPQNTYIFHSYVPRTTYTTYSLDCSCWTPLTSEYRYSSVVA